MELGCGGQDRLQGRVAEATEPGECIPHLSLLLRDLFLVGEILEAAAAAGRVVRARGVDAERAGGDDLLGDRLGEPPLHLRHSGPDRVARQPAPDEDDEAVQPGDAVAAERQRVDAQLDLFPDPNGR